MRVELGEGLQATCRVAPAAQAEAKEDSQSSSKADLSSLSSMLQARWKGSTAAVASKPEPARAGQVRSFRITRLDQAARKIELELA
jgi:small subunit ribosomal protein S1